MYLRQPKFYEKSYNFKLIPLAFQKLWHFLYKGEMFRFPDQIGLKSQIGSDRVRVKRILWIFLASSTQRTDPENFWFLYQLLLMNVSKTVWGIVLVFPWFQIIGKTIKTLGFHNNTYLIDLSSLCQSRGVFRILSNI